MYKGQFTPHFPEMDFAHETPNDHRHPYGYTGVIVILDNIDMQLRIDLVDSVLDCLMHGAEL